MKRNPVIPFAIIAVLGILTVIVISFVGVNQAEDIAQEEEGGEEQQENGQSGEDSENGGGESAEAGDPEKIFQNTCASCHGGDLSGGMGPDLTQVGGRLSKDEIKDTIMNGQGQMPAGLVNKNEADALATWLSEKK